MEKSVIKVHVALTEPMLGTVPKDKEIYKTYVASKAPVAAGAASEAETVQEVEERGWTGFHQDDSGLFVYDYFIRGFFKSAAQAMQAQLPLKNYKSKIDQFVFVFPRRIHIVEEDGAFITKPHGVIERPLRAMTMQGPRVTLARSDFVRAGATMEFEVHLLKNKDVTEQMLEAWLEYARFQGFGQFRNGSYGRAVARVM